MVKETWEAIFREEQSGLGNNYQKVVTIFFSEGKVYTFLYVEMLTV